MPSSKTSKKKSYTRGRSRSSVSSKAEKPETDEQAMRLAERDKREGKAPFIQASHFVHEEIEHAKESEHTVRNAKQAVAIGLFKARKHGIALPPRPSRKKAK